MILDIAEPWAPAPNEAAVRSMLDRYYHAEGEYPIHTVAETIFPGWEYIHHGIEGVYENYPEQYSTIKKGDSSWGRYAHRFVRRKGPSGVSVNPLEQLIRKMRRSRNGSTSAYRACYELGASDPAYELPVYDPGTDGGRLYGGPCLSHVSFKLVNNAVHLTALYRSHDYRFKVPGNLLGLARLQACISHEVRAEIGTMTIVSTLAHLGSGAMGKFPSLLERAATEMQPSPH